MGNQADIDDAQIAKTIDLSQIPIIEFGRFLNGSSEDQAAVVAEIVAACEDLGFFYLTGHGVPDALRAKVFERSAQLFHLPMEEKMQLQATEAWNRGYIFGGGKEKLDANSRTFEQYRIQREFAPDDPDLERDDPMYQPNRWPEQLVGFDADCIAYYEAMSALGAALLNAFAIGLGLPEDRFDRYFRKPISQISMMYYPALPEGVSNAVKNLSAHTDEGPVVMLAQGEIGGLEVKTAEGRWIAAPPVPGAFTVNIGNMMMWWSNGRFKSTLHRVRNTSNQERYSIPFFWNADPDVTVEPLPELVSRDGEARYKPVKVGPLLSRFYRSATLQPYKGE